MAGATVIRKVALLPPQPLRPETQPHSARSNVSFQCSQPVPQIGQPPFLLMNLIESATFGGIGNLPLSPGNPTLQVVQPQLLLLFDRCRLAVVKKVDFGYKPIVSLLSRRGLCRAAAPTVQDGSARESHLGTPNWSPFKPPREPQPARQPEPDWVCVSASPAGVALQAPVSTAQRSRPSTSTRASLASLQVR